MKNAEELLGWLHSAGVEIAASDGRLHVTAERGVITEKIKQEIAAHKEGLIKALTERPHRGQVGADLPFSALDRTSPIPLSFAQQRLWFLAQLEGASEAYHIQFIWKLKGRLDSRVLRCALDRIAYRHEALRTTFSQADGEPVQRIAPASAGFFLAEHDLRGRDGVAEELNRLCALNLSARFDLERGPLVRGLLIRLSEDEHMMLITMHHIISDGWSMAVFADELKALYAAFLAGEPDPLPELPVQYADYAAWERAALANTQIAQEHTAYWKKALEGAPALLELPSDRPRPTQQDYAGAAVHLELDDGLTQRLRELSKRHGITLYMTFLAAWSALLSRLSGQEDLIIGSPVANRSRLEFEPMIGFFVNTLPIRIDLSGSPTVSELLVRVKAQALAAQQHQALPFEQIVEAVKPQRSPAYTPVFQVMFAWANTPSPAFELPGLQVASIAAPQVTARLDLLLWLQDSNGHITGNLEYATSLFDRDTIERYLGYWKHLLKAIAFCDEEQVTRLPLLSEAERHKLLVEWNATDSDYPREKCVHELFEAQAAQTPEAIAVVHEDCEITYAELNAKANRLAHKLQSLGVQPGDYVPIFLERSVTLVVAELAVLKCGAAYVPIDPAFPAERQIFMVRDCGARIVIADAGIALPDALATTRVDVVEGIVREEPGDNPAIPADSETTAYVMYTSGSTGQPKGVMIPHRGIARLVLNSGYVKLHASDTVAFAANPAFDATTFEVWAPLLNGGRVAIISQEALLEPAQFEQCLKRHSVSVLWLTVGLFNQYARKLSAAFLGLRYLLVGGDALDPRIIDRVLRSSPPQHLLNGYGPTETTTFATTYEITAVPEGATSIPLGRPIANTSIYILDKNMEPAPIGVAGEIYIGGAGIARGYLNRPELTAERFLRDPFAKEPNARMYKTGDLGRWRADGVIEFLGRNDFQVKIRGFRIELGEIEARLREHPSIREAVVEPREDSPDAKRLVAYYTGGEGTDAKELRHHLAAALPDYMVPAAYVKLDALPLNANGKVDRKALPAPESGAFGARHYEAPRGWMEATLAEMWTALLKIERVGRHDNFFDLGGHSLLAIRLLARIEVHFGKRIKLNTVLKAPTIEQLAQKISEGESADPEYNYIAVLQNSGSMPPIFAINTASAFYSLSRKLGPNQPFIALNLFDPTDSANFSRFNFEDLAIQYVKLIRGVRPKGPYALLGWCVGGALAFEAARILAEAGEMISLIGVIDGWAPGHIDRLNPPTRTLHFLAYRWQRLWNELRTLGSVRESVGLFLSNKGFRRKSDLDFEDKMEELYAQRVAEERNDRILSFVSNLARRHEPKPFDGAIMVFKSGFEPSGWFVDKTLGWGCFARGGVDVVKVPGDHRTIFDEPGASQMATSIATALQRGVATDSIQQRVPVEVSLGGTQRVSRNTVESTTTKARKLNALWAVLCGELRKTG